MKINRRPITNRKMKPSVTRSANVIIFETDKKVSGNTPTLHGSRSPTKITEKDSTSESPFRESTPRSNQEGTKVVHCLDCGTQWSGWDALRIHKQSSCKKWEFLKCSHCYKVFFNEKHLSEHSIREHGQVLARRHPGTSNILSVSSPAKNEFTHTPAKTVGFERMTLVKHKSHPPSARNVCNSDEKQQKVDDKTVCLKPEGKNRIGNINVLLRKVKASRGRTINFKNVVRKHAWNKMKSERRKLVKEKSKIKQRLMNKKCEKIVGKKIVQQSSEVEHKTALIKSKKETEPRNILKDPPSTACVIKNSYNPFPFTAFIALDVGSFPYKCSSCKIICFKTAKDLEQHEMWCIAPDDQYFECSSSGCKRFFNSRMKLKKHENEAHGPNSDSSSAGPFTNPNTFSTIISPDAEDFPLRCFSCKVIKFKKLVDWRRHEDWCSRVPQGASGSVCCLRCSCYFRDRVLLLRHQRGPPECVDPFGSLKRNPVVSSYFDKQAGTRNSMEAGEFSPANEGLPTDSNILTEKIKMDLFTDVVKHFSSSPSTSSTTESALKLSSPFCPLCNWKVSSVQHLLDHFKAFHKLTDPENLNDFQKMQKASPALTNSLRVCLDCGLKFTSSQAQALHRNQHFCTNAAKKFQCAKCSLSFCSQIDYGRHMNLKHDDAQELENYTNLATKEFKKSMEDEEAGSSKMSNPAKDPIEIRKSNKDEALGFKKIKNPVKMPSEMKNYIEEKEVGSNKLANPSNNSTKTSKDKELERVKSLKVENNVKNSVKGLKFNKAMKNYSKCQKIENSQKLGSQTKINCANKILHSAQTAKLTSGKISQTSISKKKKIMGVGRNVNSLRCLSKYDHRSTRISNQNDDNINSSAQLLGKNNKLEPVSIPIKVVTNFDQERLKTVTDEHSVGFVKDNNLLPVEVGLNSLSTQLDLDTNKLAALSKRHQGKKLMLVTTLVPKSSILLLVSDNDEIPTSEKPHGADVVVALNESDKASPKESKVASPKKTKRDKKIPELEVKPVMKEEPEDQATENVNSGEAIIDLDFEDKIPKEEEDEQSKLFNALQLVPSSKVLDRKTIPVVRRSKRCQKKTKRLQQSLEESKKLKSASSDKKSSPKKRRSIAETMTFYSSSASSNRMKTAASQSKTLRVLEPVDSHSLKCVACDVLLCSVSEIANHNCK